MGRPKLDYTKCICSECGKQGIQLSKGKCSTCYQRDYFKVRNEDPEFKIKHMEIALEWNRDNHERHKEIKREHYARNVDVLNDRKKQYRETHPERVKELDRLKWDRNKNREISRKYGLTLEEYETLLIIQNGICAICKKEAKLNMDHDHTLKVARELLCTRCNTFVGYIEKSTPEIFDATFNYISKHKDKNK